MARSTSTKAEEPKVEEPKVEEPKAEATPEPKGIRKDPEPSYVVNVRVHPDVKWSTVVSGGVVFGREWQEFQANDPRIEEWRKSDHLEVEG